MIDMMKAMPQLGQIAGDLMVGNMDWPGASDIQARLRKTIAPNLLDEGKDKEIPPEIQAKMGQMEQMIQQLSGALEQSTEAMRQKKMELESKERIEFAKLSAQLEIARAQIESKEALEGLRQYMTGLEDDVAMMKQRLGILSVTEPILESGSMGAANS